MPTSRGVHFRVGGFRRHGSTTRVEPFPGITTCLLSTCTAYERRRKEAGIPGALLLQQEKEASFYNRSSRSPSSLHDPSKDNGEAKPGQALYCLLSMACDGGTVRQNFSFVMHTLRVEGRVGFFLVFISEWCPTPCHVRHVAS